MFDNNATVAGPTQHGNKCYKFMFINAKYCNITLRNHFKNTSVEDVLKKVENLYKKLK